jgi:ribosome recycling factor
MIDDILRESEERMKKTVDALDRDLAAIRTGHAHVGLLDHIKVDYFGSSMQLNQLATVAAPEGRMLTVQAWDRNATSAIEKALQASDLGVNPQVDGQTIRINLPPLTEQRRKDMIKVVSKRVEEGRIAIRNVRRDGIDHVKKLVNAKEASENDQHRAQDQLQKLTDRYVGSIDQRGKEKEAELSEV